MKRGRPFKRETLERDWTNLLSVTFKEKANQMSSVPGGRNRLPSHSVHVYLEDNRRLSSASPSGLHFAVCCFVCHNAGQLLCNRTHQPTRRQPRVVFLQNPVQETVTDYHVHRPWTQTHHGPLPTHTNSTHAPKEVAPAPQQSLTASPSTCFFVKSFVIEG